jgi:ATP-binding cassette subfamily F protein 3
MQRQATDAREQALRDFLGGFGFRGDDALRQVATFSGGERTRLALALLVHRRPNLLLLDEPTNHLDMLTRDALAEALQEFTGALVVVSHDRYLLRATVDRFQLVDDGRVASFDGDLDDYRDWLVRGDLGGANSRPPKRAIDEADAAGRVRSVADPKFRIRQRRPLERSLGKLEKKLETLQAERAACEARLCDQALYDEEMKAELAAEQRRLDELQVELAYTEKMWLEVGEELERFDAG